MKILHCSDWHLDRRTLGVDRFGEVRAAVRQTVDAAIREKVDLYLCTGDIADPDGGAGVLRCVEALVDVAAELSDAGIENWWVAGNHDPVEDGTGLTTLSPLHGFRSGVSVFETPNVVECQGCVVLILPYPAATNPYDPQEFVCRAKKTHLVEAKHRGIKKVVVATHLQIDGAALGEESSDMARGRDVRLPVEEFDDDWVVLAGHYHRRQTIRGPKGPPIHVAGSLARLAFGEEPNEPSYQIVEV